MCSMRTNLKPHTCCKCGDTFFTRIRIGNKKIRINNNRKYCLKCVPFKHNPLVLFGKVGKILVCETCGIKYTYNRRNSIKQCKRCNRKRLRLRTKILVKSAAVEYKGGKCKKCGYNKCLEALTFHHREPSQKEFGISKSWHAMSWNKIKRELDKCDLLCIRCHVELHSTYGMPPA